MKNYGKYVVRILPVFVLLVALVVGMIPCVSADSTEAFGDFAHHWYYYVHSLYKADEEHVGTYVFYSRNFCTWNNGEVFTGTSANVSSDCEIKLGGDIPFNLEQMPLGTVINAGFEFTVDKIYSSLEVPYFILIRYYDADGNIVGMDRSNDSVFSFNTLDSPAGCANVYFNFTLNGVTDSQTGKRYMPHSCDLTVYLCPSYNVPMSAVFTDLSCFIVLNESLKGLFPERQFSYLKTSIQRIIDERGYKDFPENLRQWAYDALLLFFFFDELPNPDDGVPNDPNDPFAGIDGSEFSSITLETITLLSGFTNAFILCGFLFNSLAGVPFFTALLYASLAIGVVMAFFGLAMQFPARTKGGDH